MYRVYVGLSALVNNNLGNIIAGTMTPKISTAPRPPMSRNAHVVSMIGLEIIIKINPEAGLETRRSAVTAINKNESATMIKKVPFYLHTLLMTVCRASQIQLGENAAIYPLTVLALSSKAFRYASVR